MKKANLSLRRIVLLVLGVFALCVWIGTAALTPAEWRMGGQNLFNTRHQQAEQRVNPTNVSSLAPRWVFTTGGDVSTTPAVVDGAVYFPDWGGNLFKVDAQTGNKVWSRRIQDYTSMPGSLSRVTPAVTEDALYLGTQFGATMLAVRKDTGDLIWKTQLDDHFQATITQSAVVFQQRVYVGTS
jgi:polyvinyl alcohol dehydrogenase (cytochrome)